MIHYITSFKEFRLQLKCVFPKEGYLLDPTKNIVTISGVLGVPSTYKDYAPNLAALCTHTVPTDFPS